MAEYSLKDLISKAKEKKGLKAEPEEKAAAAVAAKKPVAGPATKPVAAPAPGPVEKPPASAGEKKKAIDELKALIGDEEQGVKPPMPAAPMPPMPATEEAAFEAKPIVGRPMKKAVEEKAPVEPIKGIEKPAVREEISEAAAAEAQAPDAHPEKSTVEKEVEKAKKIEIAKYGDVKIYKVPGKPLLYYFVPVPRPTASERLMINTIKEAATRVISIAPYKIRDPQQRRNVYYQKIMEILRASPELNIPERRYQFYANAVVREMVGYGLIDSLISDDKLEEIMIIGPKMPVYIFHREYEMMITNIEFYSDSEVQDLINRIARQIGRRVDISSPLLDARLPDGSRVNATIPPASVAGSTLTIRKFRTDPYSVADMVNYGTVSAEVAAFLWLCVEGMGTKPANILIAGGTGSGKTTLLNVLASFVAPSERIVSIEDTAELNLPLQHWIRLEARPPSLEGRGELTIDILTKNSLRMRPDRVIVGEIRHEEAFTLFTAINTGHDGSMGTVHANSAQETLARVTSPPMSVPEIMLSGLDFILVEHRIHDKKKGTIRRVSEIAEVTGVLGGKANTQVIFERDAIADVLRRTAVPCSYLKELQKFTGMGKKQVEDELVIRERFLKKLADSGIRNMDEVSLACQEFLAKRREGK